MVCAGACQHSSLSCSSAAWSGRCVPGSAVLSQPQLSQQTHIPALMAGTALELPGSTAQPFSAGLLQEQGAAPPPLSFCCPCRTGDAVVLCRQELFFSPSSSSSFWTSYNCERDWSSTDHRPVLLCTPAVMEVEVTLQPGQQAEGSLGSPADGFPECNSGHTYR